MTDKPSVVEALSAVMGDVQAVGKTCTVPGCGKKHLARGWCAMHYSRMRNHGSLADPPSHQERTASLEDRLWPRIDKSGDCWIWTGAINASGYGAIGNAGKVLRVHRVVYDLLVGPIPDGLQLDHLCRVRACCRPDHLEPVDNRTNWLRGEHPTAVMLRTDRCQRGHIYSVHRRARPDGTGYCGACALLHERKAS